MIQPIITPVTVSKSAFFSKSALSYSASGVFHIGVLAVVISACLFVTAPNDTAQFATSRIITSDIIEPDDEKDAETELSSSGAQFEVQPDQAFVADRRYVKVPAAKMDQQTKPVSEGDLAVTKSTSEKQQVNEPASSTALSKEQVESTDNASQRKRTVRPPLPKVTSQKSSSWIDRPGFSEIIPPTYPAAAELAGLEGTVILKIRVNTNGSITVLKILKSSGHPILDGQAVSGIGRNKITPAMSNGKPVAYTKSFRVTFNIP